MATTPQAPNPQQPTARLRLQSRFRFSVLTCLCILFVLCIVFSWLTRDAMGHLSFLQQQSKGASLKTGLKTIVDLTPWQTAQALSPLAVSAEELQYAHEAERLADHEVDQAFASALRLAATQTHPLTGEALELSQKVPQLQQTVKDDQAQVQQLTQAAASNPGASSDDLEVAKAQLGLDTDQLNDAQQDLARASGDQRGRIQQELAAHEAAMKKEDSAAQEKGEVAVLSTQKYHTLAHRISAWFSQRSRSQLIQQAIQESQTQATALTAEHNALEAKANAPSTPVNGQSATTATRLALIKQKADQRQLLSIYDDRIQTEQQLATVYSRWSAQVQLQHRILLHLILQSVAVILFTIICVILCDMLIRHLLENPNLDRRRRLTLRNILQLCVQITGTLIILFIIFGAPSQISTMLGLATAGLTVVLQDFILGFCGWFVLMGRNGIHIGDTVEINGVNGEVIEIGLFRTAILETGNWTDNGHPTGRRITFINKYAISGNYFNFTTTSQWMWDELNVSLATTDDTYPMIDRIQAALQKATEEDTKLAEEEWKRASRHYGLDQYSAAPTINLRPASPGVTLIIRYVTRASQRSETRNRLYDVVMNAMQTPQEAAPTLTTAT